MARYGEVGGRIGDGGHIGFAWWKNLISIGKCVGLGVGHWFDDNLRCCESLKHGFRRLFDPAENKMVSVADISLLGWSVEGMRGSDVGVCWLGRRRRWRCAIPC